MNEEKPTWYVPTVPSAPVRDRVDLGVAGSLRAAQSRERTSRLVRRGPLHRDLPVLGGLVLIAVAVVLVSLSLKAAVVDRSPMTYLYGLAALPAMIGFWPVGKRWGKGPAETRLGESIRAETELAWHLEQLHSSGWTVLVDRLVPGTEARLPFVLIGPGGVVLVTPTPAAGPWDVVANNAFLAGRPLSHWVHTRQWEMHTVNEALAVAADDLEWTGPTRAILAVAPVRPTLLKPPPAKDVVGEHPSSISDLPLLGYHHVAQTILDCPAPLPRELAVSLALRVEMICPPAGVRDRA